MSNRTEQDARDRVADARAGSMVEATETYLVQLRAQLLRWVADVDAELAVRTQARSARAAHLDLDGCEHRNTRTPASGHGSFCVDCGETLS